MNDKKVIFNYTFKIPSPQIISIPRAMAEIEREMREVDAEIYELTMLTEDEVTDVSDAKRELSRIFNV